MGNSSCFPSFENFNNTKNLSVDDFKQLTVRKMTIYLLSDEKEKCKNFVELITKQKFPGNSTQLLEKNIEKKIDIYSFMNYEIGIDASEIIDKIIKKANDVSSHPLSKKFIFSELIILFDNNNINKQLEIIDKKLYKEKQNKMFFKQKPYLLPFLIIISPRNLELKNFLSSKTFQFRINPRDIMHFYLLDNTILKLVKSKNINKIIPDEETKLIEEEIEADSINIQNIYDNKNNNILNEEEKEYIHGQCSLFKRKLNVIFSYYNELGDEFSFKNSDGNEILINNEAESSSPVFINIILIGKTGAGKSTLINLILEEKKSLEGGDGFSTTSKNILVYKKNNLALRFYDVKGIESDENTLKNYVKILTDFNGNKNPSKDKINAIFYCKSYEDSTTIDKGDEKIIEELINFDIPILFLFTKTPYDLRKKENEEKEEYREYERNTKITAINEVIKNCFKEVNKESESEVFIKQYVHYYFINLIENLSLNVPVFGIDNVLHFFKKSVPKEDWENLKKSCNKNDSEKCHRLCEENPFLKNFSNYDEMNERNKAEALSYIKRLKLSAFVSGAIPIIDILSETGYRALFKWKLNNLYGFNCIEAEEQLKKKEGNKMTQILSEEYSKLNNTENTNSTINEKQDKVKEVSHSVENKIEGKINNKSSKLKEYLLKAAKRVVDVGIPIASFALKVGVKTIGIAFIPITTIVSAYWSRRNIDKDCNTYLDIFVEAFEDLKFTVLEHYIDAFIEIIEGLDDLGKKLVKDNKE